MKLMEAVKSKAAAKASQVEGAAIAKLDKYLYNMNNSNMKYYIAGGVALLLVVVLILVLTNKSKEGYGYIKRRPDHPEEIRLANNKDGNTRIDRCREWRVTKCGGGCVCKGVNLRYGDEATDKTCRDHIAKYCLTSLNSSQTDAAAWQRSSPERRKWCIEAGKSDRLKFPDHVDRLLFVHQCMFNPNKPYSDF